MACADLIETINFERNEDLVHGFHSSLVFYPAGTTVALVGVFLYSQAMRMAKTKKAE